MNTALLDFRQAIRNMRKSLGSTLLAVLMLAVGIGATSAIFSVFYSVLIEPLPFPEPSRLVQLWESRLKNQWNQASFTEANFWDIQERNRTFEGIACLPSMERQPDWIRRSRAGCRRCDLSGLLSRFGSKSGRRTRLPP